jgi:outer membrane receptor protein involved in Fe transport
MRGQPSGTVAAVFVQDTVDAASWLSLTGGLRYAAFSGGVSEEAISPRLGASIRISAINSVVRAFYGRFYQEPPLATASGPLVDLVTAQDLRLMPLHGERDREYQLGIAVPLKGWTIDADHFRTRATNFFDHNPIGNSNVFFPVTIDGAVIRGAEVTLRSPRRWSRGSLHFAYAYQTARGEGTVSGGLGDASSFVGSFLLDHDQRHTLSAGFNANQRRGASVAATMAYGSGLPDEGGPAHLRAHATTNVTVAKAISRTLSISITALNVLNSRVLIDNSLTFGGTHFNSPREIYGELRWRVRY